jgi:F-type H+-transporting ATPase subunit gamma
MNTLQDIRRRQASIRSTQQMTMAMKMVSAARLVSMQKAWSKSLSLIQVVKPWTQRLLGIFLSRWLGDFSHGTDRPDLFLERESLRDKTDGKNFPGTLDLENSLSYWVSEVKSSHCPKHLLVLLTTDRGLNGSFTPSLLREACSFLDLKKSLGEKVYIVCVGQKGADFLRRHNIPDVVAQFSPMGNLSSKLTENILNTILETIELKDLQECHVIYGKFHNALSQEIVTRRLLPLVNLKEETFLEKPLWDIKNKEDADVQWLLEQMDEGMLGYSPNLSSSVDGVCRLFFKGFLHGLFKEHLVSEYSARMMAMDTASTNAQDILRQLRLDYNRTRQALITREIVEVISGSMGVE